MSKRTIIIAVLAVVLFVIALISLLIEKNAIQTELDTLLNGESENKEPENIKSDERTEPAQDQLV